MGKDRDQDVFIMPMVLNTRDNGQLIVKKDMQYLQKKQEKYLKDNLLMIEW